MGLLDTRKKQAPLFNLKETLNQHDTNAAGVHVKRKDKSP